MNVLYRVLIALSVAAVPLACMADNIELSVTLMARPVCTVSDKGARMDVRFGNLAINRIDGEQYRKAIPYQINCPGASTRTSWRMRLTLKGNPAGFEPNKALETSVPDLGIKVMFDGTALAPEQPRLVQITPTAVPLLEAVPVKRAGGELPGIGFTASALLLAEFY